MASLSNMDALAVPKGPADELRDQFFALWGKDYIHTALFIHDKVFPAGLQTFEMAEHPDHIGDADVRNFTITYPKDKIGVIKRVGDWGYEKAIGMKVAAKSVIKGTFYGLNGKERKIVFEDHTLSVNPGKLYPTVRLLEISMKGNQVILGAKANGFGSKTKVIPWHVFEFIDTCTGLEWLAK